MGISQQKFIHGEPIDARFGNVTVGALSFDLLCVLALIQLSYLLFQDCTWQRFALTSILWLSVWREWRYAGWAAWKLGHDHESVYRVCHVCRVAIFSGLISTLSVLSESGSHSLYFALTFSVAQAIRAGMFIRLANRGASSFRVRGYPLRCVAVSPILWLVGGTVEDTNRLAWWTAAMLLDLTPMLADWRLWVRRESLGLDWSNVHSQFVRRYWIVVSVALMVAASSTEMAFSYVTILSLRNCIEFFGAITTLITMFFLYFSTSISDSVGYISQSSNTDRAITIFFMINGLLVSGIVITAFSNWQMLMSSAQEPHPTSITLMILGPLAYLLGSGWYKWIVYHRLPTSHTVAVLAVVVMAITTLCQHFSPELEVLMISIALSGVAWVEAKLTKTRNAMAIHISHVSSMSDSNKASI
ncbi:low temperature requirement protein A [Burkholderia cenocepacia]|uniref:low temperature requirement protein A n=1 Tax=Burkholderia cenocepacia TaxID=95486 RepID=UPI000F67B0A9|nr:low temperature requirement protein A [Burkholderia cenocepacia]MBN3530992.1 low temperature requirement protein A [Burkholderia cenocepacia]MBO1859388.1 low temperature requirement protein A [Burkholderia cenocepacia]MBR8030351.1 low temperature requirement protein A [Burkholderia cenocepacia]MBR8174228.1 low temperature requirement protein A [Burkholderia cenocepacia]MBR8427951.1 low temperature requirement protein A [Burkholderia cenocepacia]